MADFFHPSLIVHRQLRGKIGVCGEIPIENREDLSLARTPGIARPCEGMADDPAVD